MRLYTILAILLPISFMAISWGIASLIPGCTIDEGAGAAAACGVLGSLLAFGVLGGFLWFIFGVLGLIPALIIYALVNKDESPRSPSNFLYRGYEEEIEKDVSELENK